MFKLWPSNSKSVSISTKNCDKVLNKKFGGIFCIKIIKRFDKTMPPIVESKLESKICRFDKVTFKS